MNPIFIILIILGVLILISPAIIIPFVIANKVFKNRLCRISNEKWGKVCSDTTNEEQVIMWDYSMKFLKENEDKHKVLHIVNDNLNLYADYFDFGFDKAVIMVAGRAESSYYALYYTSPYIKAGYNILSIDTRSHGDSEGIYNTVGLKEHQDVIKWANLLHDSYNIKEITLHGICIGSATSIYAVTSKNTPDYIKSIVVDGVYKNFLDTLKRHIKDLGHQPFPVANIVCHKISKVGGYNLVKFSPENKLKDVKIPILLLHSKKDIFSVPENTKIMYETITAKKKLVWFDKGAHSHIRINNQEKYDEEIIDFLGEVNG